LRFNVLPETGLSVTPGVSEGVSISNEQVKVVLIGGFNESIPHLAQNPEFPNFVVREMIVDFQIPCRGIRVALPSGVSRRIVHESRIVLRERRTRLIERSPNVVEP